jgi:hypothetical protein
VNSTKAYLIRYGSTKAWIVNPSATSEAGFKIGELDLSAYADADGVPEMCCGVIANDKLFIVMQRLVDWCPTETPYVAVFDIATDTEINTGMGSGAMLGVPLNIKNPGSVQYLPENNLVYVQGVGTYPGGSCDPVYEYTGGIESLNPYTYATAVVLDDGTQELHPYGAISGMLIASPSKGYFVGYDGWGDNTVYAFNPTTGVVSGAVTGLQNINISGMNSGTYLDKNEHDVGMRCDQRSSQNRRHNKQFHQREYFHKSESPESRLLHPGNASGAHGGGVGFRRQNHGSLGYRFRRGRLLSLGIRPRNRMDRVI